MQSSTFDGWERPQVHDEFVGLYSVPQTDAGTITTVTTECVLPVETTSEHFADSVTIKMGTLVDRERVLL